MRQHHYVGTVKHVGIVRTSKSQQFAFEVVVKDDAVLFFGCENQILREEWISAFVDVMNSNATEENNQNTENLPAKNVLTHSTVERKGSLNGMCFSLLFKNLKLLVNSVVSELTTLGLFSKVF